MSTSIRLPTAEHGLQRYEFTGPRSLPEFGAPVQTRKVFAAAHVVADPLGDHVGTGAVDWESTLAFREYLWSLGLGVAEAMDTAQRGSGLKPSDVDRLIEASIQAAQDCGGAIVCGVGTDGLDDAIEHSLGSILNSYLSQLDFVQGLGGTAVVMASRALAASATVPDEYVSIYNQILVSVDRPVIIHWLGPQFDPALRGYWGSDDPYEAMETVLAIINANRRSVDGVKLSLLDAELEIAFRKRLPDGVRCYTGDDFNYPELIAGDGNSHSDALLGILDPIAPVAAAAFRHLDVGDLDQYHMILEPTVALARHIFQEPTSDYKTGVVFLAYLTGHQSHFRMLGGREGARSVVHLAETVRLADAAGLFDDPEDVVRRLRPLLQAAGIE